MQLDSAIITGQVDTHLIEQGEFAGLLHRQVAGPFEKLRTAAQHAGLGLRIASAWRSFDRQLLIWNAKARGERPIRNAQGEAVDISGLSDLEIMHAILRWSALPGASRHHWGTDMDVYDADRVDEAVGPQLLSAEYQQGGPCGPLNDWLAEHLEEFGFYRPYQRDSGGIAPEPWHISFRSLAEPFARRLEPAILAEPLAKADLELREPVLRHLDEIFERYIQIA